MFNSWTLARTSGRNSLPASIIHRYQKIPRWMLSIDSTHLTCPTFYHFLPSNYHCQPHSLDPGMKKLRKPSTTILIHWNVPRGTHIMSQQPFTNSSTLSTPLRARVIPASARPSLSTVSLLVALYAPGGTMYYPGLFKLFHNQILMAPPSQPISSKVPRHTLALPGHT